MKYEYMHPRDELALTLERIYNYKMTTTSGGNLSIKDDNGDIWITPARVDKGELVPSDIVCVRRDGTIEGRHPPSSEFPFHKAIYEVRSDIRSVVHAHPMALVAFSCAHKVPETKAFPTAWNSNGKVGFAPYGVPGSDDLGTKIATEFQKGYDSVILENHGVCCGGQNLQDAFGRFESLELCAKALIKAAMIGTPQFLSEEQIQMQQKSYYKLEAFEYDTDMMTIKEKELRCELARFVRRGYRQRLLTGATGTFSARIDEHSFLITPYPLDRHTIEPEDLVMIRKNKKQIGKKPSRGLHAHRAIYEANPEVNCIVNALPVNALSFSICNKKVDTYTIPESYVFVGDVNLLPFESAFNDFDVLTKALTLKNPAAVLENNGVMVVGKDILLAFDKLEVLECSAEAIIDSQPIGGHVPMSQETIDELCEAFDL
ncbi:MAG: class II aldolase/adducin family protein [Kiritimatiellales bacterium]|nr:class II aldolase/adducin family protein [Kiritimatiellales bacterium]MCF7863882.1 class II aldolase/adducin family protein [Kiritimatiellales bacterium]